MLINIEPITAEIFFVNDITIFINNSRNLWIPLLLQKIKENGAYIVDLNKL